MSRSLIIATILSLATATSAVAQDAAKGAQVYNAQKCSVCHSIAGKGNTKGALDTVGSKLTPANIRAWIVDATGMAAKANATRKPPMKNYALPPADLDALVAYLASLK